MSKQICHVVYECVLALPEEKIDECSRLLRQLTLDESDPLDSAIYTETVSFPDGKEMDIKLCSGISNYFLDIVLFDSNGCERKCMLGDDKIDDTFELEDDDIIYRVIVHREENGADHEMRIIIENTDKSDEDIRQTVSFKKAWDDIYQSALEDEYYELMIRNHESSESIEDFARRKADNLAEDIINGKAVEYRGYTYSLSNAHKDRQLTKDMIQQIKE